MSIVGSLFPKIFSLLSLVFIVILGFIVLKNSRKLLNKLFFLLTLILDCWVIGSFMMFSSTQDSQIIFWDRFVYAAVVFWPALQYHFSLAVTYTNKNRRRLLRLAYLLSPIFLLISQTDYFVKDVFRYAWGAHTKAQFLHHFFLAFFALYGCLFFYNLIKKYRSENDRLERKRILYYILGFCVLDFIGGTAFLPAYLISFYPIFLATPLVFSLIIAYAIVYFGLMDIKLIMRRYFVYFLSLFSVLAPTYICLFYVFIFYPRYLFVASLIIFIFSLSVFSKIKNYFYKFSNRYFFSSLYDFNELIFNLNNRLRASLDISQIFQSTIGVLTQAFHSQATAVISYEARTKNWSILYNNGFTFKNQQKIILDYQIMNALFPQNTPLSLASLEKLLDNDHKNIFNYLNDLKVELIVPIKVNQIKLNSLMIFGPKESNESYNAKDLKVLESVAAEIGISLENALLYRSVTRFNVKLKEEINKATKQLQEQNETLKKLDQIKTEFIGIASHQLRTPLTGIRWFTELLMNNKEGNLSPKQLDFLEQISSSNRRMIKLVNDLLDVSHIETGRKFDIIKTDFNLNEVIQEVVKENIFLISTKSLIIKNEILKDFTVFADRDKIKQVWQNLISNATKYSGEKTTIRIFSTLKDKVPIFCVTDQGIGIPKNQQTQIFAKFFRASNASLQHSDGTGLGLYIAREIIRAHGGDLWFESQENKGSTFSFSLPIVKNDLKTNNKNLKTNKNNK